MFRFWNASLLRRRPSRGKPVPRDDPASGRYTYQEKNNIENFPTNKSSLNMKQMKDINPL